MICVFSVSDTCETWQIRRIKSVDLRWGTTHKNTPHCCPHCHIELLTGEHPGFCCGKNGKYANDPPPLPNLPAEFDTFLNNPHISAVSRLLNLIFSFAALESSHEFPPLPPGGPSFVAMEGRLYHHVRPTHQQSAVQWLLYDGFSHASVPHANSPWASKVPSSWIDAVREALSDCNPFVRTLRLLAGMDPLACPTAHIRLGCPGTGNEIAAIMNYDNTTLGELNSRQCLVVRRDGTNQSVSTISRLWEPLAYPLLFPHGTLGWGVVGSLSVILNDRLDDVQDPDLQADGCGRQIMFYRVRLLREPKFRVFGKLTNEYAVDMLSHNLETRLNYIRANQKRV
jgi:hypothetical protein